MTGHDTGGLQELVNKEKGTERGNEVVTQKKSSELPKRDLEGSEVPNNIKHLEDCDESTISQVIVVGSEVVSARVCDWTVQETEKFRDGGEANESKYEAENGLERSLVAVCNTLIK